MPRFFAKLFYWLATHWPTEVLMQALLKFLIQNYSASLAKLVMGMALGSLLVQYSLDAAMLSAALNKVELKLNGGTVTYATAEEQELVEGLVELLTPVLTYWKFPLTAVELAPLVKAIAARIALRIPPTP